MAARISGAGFCVTTTCLLCFNMSSSEGAKEATGITLATLVLGALAIAAGAPEAGMAVLMAGQRAALGRFLAFTRTQEASADQAAAKYLHDTGTSGQGFLKFFSKLQNQE